jgi:antitoxin FitA
MPKTVQIRDIDDDVYAGLRRRAAEEGVTVPELLRAEAARMAARPSIRTWLESTRRRSTTVDAATVVEGLRELRHGDADR